MVSLMQVGRCTGPGRTCKKFEDILMSVGLDYFGRVTCFAPDQRDPVIVTPSPNMWNIGKIAWRKFFFSMFASLLPTKVVS